ncbi:MAG TPA: hypothetical protein VGR37_22895, partial [Longimicrobiaceae bacterium]|nr:hypothetical protein [Longimicrobiaceae bacterium]
YDTRWAADAPMPPEPRVAEPAAAPVPVPARAGVRASGELPIPAPAAVEVFPATRVRPEP